MPRFRSLSSEDLDLFAPAFRTAESFPVEALAEVEVAGDVSDETEDAYIVGVGGDARAWSKTLWVLADKEKPAAPAAPAVKEK